jgi:hypothetical protein
MKSWRRWTLVLAVGVVAALLGVPALAATQAPPTGVSTHVDQATLDVDWAATGRQLQINAGNIVTVSSEGITSSSVAAVNISDTYCSDSGCGGTNFADCRPAGREQYDYTLPPGALRFGPSPSQATLQATFSCTRAFVGSEFSLVVDLVWSSNARLWGGGWLNSLWSASITGTASDGTTDFNSPPNTGVIVHSTY